MLSIVAVVAASLVAFAVPLSVAVRGLLVDRALDRLEASADQVAVFVDDRARTCGEVDLVLATVSRDTSIAVSLFDRDGELLAASSGRRGTVGTEVDAAADGATGRRHGAGELAVAVPLSTRACSRPLLLQASVPDDELVDETRRALRGLLGGGVGVLLLAIGVGVVTARRLARPLDALASSATRLGEGDFAERAPRSGLPEPDAIAAALDRTAERLDRATERSRSFTADASHQLRTPLTALRLHLDLAELATGEDRVEALAEAQAELDRVVRAVDDLVALTDVGADETEIDLADLVADVCAGMQPLAAAADRALTVDALGSVRVLARVGAIRQALQVLLDNALTHGMGDVVVSLRPTLPDADAAGVRVTVSDEGSGPDDRAVRWLMARDRADLPPLQGGRGLLLARRLVEGEGGRLTVTPGVARVTITLPLAPD